MKKKNPIQLEKNEILVDEFLVFLLQETAKMPYDKIYTKTGKARNGIRKAFERIYKKQGRSK